jgi:mannosyltransferase OCH1-like enzyme
MIPKKIHQIYFNLTGKEIEQFPMFLKSKEICQGYSDYEYTLWNEESCRNLISEHYPSYLDFYDAFRYEIQKIDFVRFCILHRHGGFYIDMDMFILKPLDALRGKEFVFHNIRHVKERWSWIENDFIGSVQGSRLWESAMKECVKNYKEKESIDIYDIWKGRFVLQTTGPRFLSRFIKKVAPSYKPMHIAHTKWSKDGTEQYYIEDFKANTWIDHDKKVVK